MIVFLQGVNNLPAHGVGVELGSVLVSEIREAERVDDLKQRDLIGAQTLEVPHVRRDVLTENSVPKLHRKVAVAICPDLSADLLGVTGFRNGDGFGVNSNFDSRLGLGSSPGSGPGLGLCLGLCLGPGLSLLAEHRLAGTSTLANGAAVDTVDRHGWGVFVLLDDGGKLGGERHFDDFQSLEVWLLMREGCGERREEKKGGGKQVGDRVILL